ncbi:uncharacterized protein LOC130261529 [Oenanthe melanoleuca]|uniref:uncharacterized protein LOC130261529 n=1 Tax=Oenanthe melanoleuca TaxID=2939378 RepID=UPI0024C175E1|nr:uncharacterized protein LOC130261529 [Oenanthe melanoleuca]
MAPAGPGPARHPRGSERSGPEPRLRLRGHPEGEGGRGKGPGKEEREGGIRRFLCRAVWGCPAGSAAAGRRDRSACCKVFLKKAVLRGDRLRRECDVSCRTLPAHQDQQDSPRHVHSQPHRLREPFPPARPDHSALLFPGNSDCWQGGYCSLQAASSAPEHLGTLEPLLSQIGMTNPGSTWGMLCNQRGCKDGSRQRSILLSPVTISPCQDFGQRSPSSHSH